MYQRTKSGWVQLECLITAYKYLFSFAFVYVEIFKKCPVPSASRTFEAFFKGRNLRPIGRSPDKKKEECNYI